MHTMELCVYFLNHYLQVFDLHSVTYSYVNAQVHTSIQSMVTWYTSVYKPYVNELILHTSLQVCKYGIYMLYTLCILSVIMAYVLMFADSTYSLHIIVHFIYRSVY